MARTVGSGKYTYDMVEEWAQLPPGWDMPAAAVAADSQDRVYCFNRSPEHPVIVFDPGGGYLYSWGAGLFESLGLADVQDLPRGLARFSTGHLCSATGRRHQGPHNRQKCQEVNFIRILTIARW
jgi:hypothetical protein